MGYGIRYVWDLTGNFVMTVAWSVTYQGRGSNEASNKKIVGLRWLASCLTLLWLLCMQGTEVVHETDHLWALAGVIPGSAVCSSHKMITRTGTHDSFVTHPFTFSLLIKCEKCHANFCSYMRANVHEVHSDIAISVLLEFSQVLRWVLIEILESLGLLTLMNLISGDNHYLWPY